jgi:hypothetical protein
VSRRIAGVRARLPLPSFTHVSMLACSCALRVWCVRTGDSWLLAAHDQIGMMLRLTTRNDDGADQTRPEREREREDTVSIKPLQSPHQSATATAVHLHAADHDSTQRRLWNFALCSRCRVEWWRGVRAAAIVAAVAAVATDDPSEQSPGLLVVWRGEAELRLQSRRCA